MLKSVYVCGPLTELSAERQSMAKKLYVKIAELAEQITGVRGFVPHEHYDPIINANFTPQEVDAAERDQVCNNTSCLVVVALEPSFGAGIEVEMANRSGVPVILLCENEKLRQRKISRLLRGNPAVRMTIAFASQDQLLAELKIGIKQVLGYKID